MVDERISRAIDNDHTAAMKITSDGQKIVRRKGGSNFNALGGCYVCTICKKLFKTHSLYRKHLKIHSDKAFVCHLCNKSFAHKHYLLSHMLIHSKPHGKPFACPHCPKRFSKKSNLTQHIKFHSPDSDEPKKLFSCEVCKKDFYQQEHLKSHLRQHTNERPFQCEICDKSFNIKSSLQRHMNCHTGAKPFICDICNRGYTRRSVLMLHIQQVHENKKPYQCSECQTCFSQKGNLQAHFRRKHLKARLEGKRGHKDRDKSQKRIRKQQQGTMEQQLANMRFNLKNMIPIQVRSPNKKIPTSLYESNNSFIKTPEADYIILDTEPSKDYTTPDDSKDDEKVELLLNTYDIEATEKDHDLASEMCISTSGKDSASQRLNTESIENGELFRFLNSSKEDNQAPCHSDSSDSLPTFVNPYIFSNDTQEDVKISADLDMLLATERHWDDILSDNDIFVDVEGDDIHTDSPYSDADQPFSSSLSSHNYACSSLNLIPEITEDSPKGFNFGSVTSSSKTLPAKGNYYHQPLQISPKKNLVKDSPKSKGKTITFNIYKNHKMHLTSPTTTVPA